MTSFARISVVLLLTLTACGNQAPPAAVSEDDPAPRPKRAVRAAPDDEAAEGEAAEEEAEPTPKKKKKKVARPVEPAEDEAATEDEARDEGGIEPEPTRPADAPRVAEVPERAAPKGPAEAPAPTGGVSCEAVANHVDAVIRATGTATTIADLGPVADEVARCERERWPQEPMACMMAARDVKGIFYGCLAKLLQGPPKIGRRFDALEDNSAASPAVTEVDGDYLAIDKQCGMLFQRVPPAVAVYYACSDKIQGPLMLGDEVRELVAALSAEESQRHRLASSLIAKLRTNNTVVREYDVNGNYRGSRPDF